MDFYLATLLQGLCFSGVALGIFISMKIFNIPDITTGGSYTLGGAITGMMLTNNHSAWFTLLIVIIAGAISGAITGLIHTKLKINALLAGIIVMTGLYSINLVVMGRSNIPLNAIPTLFSLINLSSNPNKNTLFVLLVFVLLLTLIIGYLLKTDFGISMRATGSSETMIRALGVNTDMMKIIGLAIANALTAVSGYLITQSQGYADINMGVSIVIVGLGSVVIAEVFINWLRITSIWLSLSLAMLGAIAFEFAVAVTLNLGVDATLLQLVTAVFVLLIVGIPRLSFKKSS
jgi:putative tryptophan/tyrosine transport system permease protein